MFTWKMNLSLFFWLSSDAQTNCVYEKKKYLYLVTRKWRNMDICSLLKSAPTQNRRPPPNAMKCLDPRFISGLSCTWASSETFLPDMHTIEHWCISQRWIHFTNLKPWRIKGERTWVDARVQVHCWRADHHSPSCWNCVPCHQCLSKGKGKEFSDCLSCLKVLHTAPSVLK